jgi:hypothetical protein
MLQISVAARTSASPSQKRETKDITFTDVDKSHSYHPRKRQRLRALLQQKRQLATKVEREKLVVAACWPRIFSILLATTVA